MDKFLQTLYDFTPLSGSRVRAIAYERGYAIAVDELCALYKFNYDPALEGKSINKWGGESPHIDTGAIFSTIKSFTPESDARWWIDMSKANGFEWTIQHHNTPIEQFVVQLDKTYIPFQRVAKMFRLMKAFDVKILYNTDTHLYCGNETLFGFMSYSETDEQEFVLTATKLTNFPKLEEI